MLEYVGSRHWDAVQKKERALSNGVVIVLVPFERHKGRHWQAWADETRTQLVGEWKTWQQSHYIAQPKIDGVSSYGRGGGKYETWMVRESWVAGLDTPEAPDTERVFNDWKKLLASQSDFRTKTSASGR